jgi:hypothetical protein
MQNLVPNFVDTAQYVQTFNGDLQTHKQLESLKPTFIFTEEKIAKHVG